MLSPDAKMIFKLCRSLYGLKQAAYRWSEDVTKTLQKEGFHQIDADNCVYTHRDDAGKIVCVIAIHVDDMLLVAHDQVRAEIEGRLMQHYKMTKGPARLFLKMKITYSECGQYLYLSQPDYAQQIVREAQMTGCATVRTPMDKIPVAATSPATKEEKAFMADKDYSGLV
jgi:hypothetical protein